MIQEGMVDNCDGSVGVVYLKPRKAANSVIMWAFSKTVQNGNLN